MASIRDEIKKLREDFDKLTLKTTFVIAYTSEEEQNFIANCQTKESLIIMRCYVCKNVG